MASTSMVGVRTHSISNRDMSYLGIYCVLAKVCAYSLLGVLMWLVRWGADIFFLMFSAEPKFA